MRYKKRLENTEILIGKFQLLSSGLELKSFFGIILSVFIMLSFLARVQDNCNEPLLLKWNFCKEEGKGMNGRLKFHFLLKNLP